MRKSLVMALCTMMLVIASMANATEYIGTADAPGGWLNAGQSQSWDIPITADFQIPYDTLQSATLQISAISKTGKDGVTSYNNGILTAIGTLNKSDNILGIWWFFDNTLFPNITSVFSNGWTSGQPLNVTVVAGGTGNSTLELGSSMLTLEYTNVDGPGNNNPPTGDGTSPTPTPEPGTLLLLGSGLSGLAFWGKRRRVEA